MKEKIIKIIRDKFEKSRGGISLIELGELLKIGQEELKTELNILYKEGKIKVRQGINHKLIYIK